MAKRAECYKNLYDWHASGMTHLKAMEAAMAEPGATGHEDAEPITGHEEVESFGKDGQDMLLKFLTTMSDGMEAQNKRMDETEAELKRATGRA
jgi:hypothetical protein